MYQVSIQKLIRRVYLVSAYTSIYLGLGTGTVYTGSINLLIDLASIPSDVKSLGFCGPKLFKSPKSPAFSTLFRGLIL